MLESPLPDASHSRRGLLGKALVAGVAAVPVMGYFTSTAKAATLTVAGLSAGEKEAFTDILLHEVDHVARIKKAIGNKARPEPTFKNLTTTSFDQFANLARAFENVGVGAYLGALPAISSKEYVAFAGSIALIEARHAGFLNVLLDKDVSLQASTGIASAVDKPLTIQQIVAAVSPYIVSLNGGPAPTFTAGDDLSIVNFALLLEYFERDFYQINIPKYFK